MLFSLAIYAAYTESEMAAPSRGPMSIIIQTKLVTSLFLLLLLFVLCVLPFRVGPPLSDD